MSEEIHDVQFETVYGPAYPGLIEAGQGRWFYHKNISGEVLGTIWTDDKDGFGFIPTELGNSVQMEQAQFRRSLANQGVSASDGFDAAVEWEEDYSDEVIQNSGDLSEVIDAALEERTHRVDPVTAAIPVRGEVVDTTSYGISLADDDVTVLDLVKVDENGVYVRESDAWVALDPDAEEEDERVYGHIWYDVSEDAVSVFDSNFTEKAPTKEDFSTFILS